MPKLDAVRGGDDVASRTKIAAAACVLASGLLVGGSCASLAFAEPDQGQNGDTAGASPSGAPGTSGPKPSGTAAAEPTTEAPKTGVSAPGDTGAPSEKPVTQVGDGRNGLPADETGVSTAPATPSKHSEPDAEVPPQTNAPEPGEHAGDAGAPAPGAESGATAAAAKESAEALPTGTTTAPTIDPAPEDPTKLAEDPKDGDPEEGDPEEEPEHPGWPFPCWWPIPDPGNPPGGGGGGGGGGGAEPPVGHPAPVPPPMQLPFPPPQVPELPGIPFEPVLDAVNGLATAAAQLPFVPITLPVIVVPSVGVPGAGGGGGGAGAGGAGGPGLGPRPGGAVPPVTGRSGGKPATPPAEKPSSPPAFSAGSGSAPAPSYRAGYVDYLRAAGLGEVAAVAVPGVTGILILTGVGGLLGYRQARAGHIVRASGTGRFMG